MTANPIGRPPEGDPLDLYLDGLLKGEALAQFERRIAAEPALRDLVAQHRAIEGRLKTEYRPPACRITLPTQDAGAQTPARILGHGTAGRGSLKFPIKPRFLAYAAVIALVAVAGYWQLQPSGPKSASQLSIGTVYSRLMTAKFKPEFVCTTDEKFNSTMKDRFGQGLLIASAPNIELIGWAYSTGYSGSVISKDELILMAKVDGKETLVFMDRKSHEPGWGPFGGIKEFAPAGMKVFRGEVGEMVLYELSASDKPVLIDRAYIPE